MNDKEFLKQKMIEKKELEEKLAQVVGVIDALEAKINGGAVAPKKTRKRRAKVDQNGIDRGDSRDEYPEVA